MLKIIKFGTEYNIPKTAIATINAAYDGIRIILNDRTEISFQMNVSPQIKALVPVLTTANAEIVTFNLDAAISGEYDKVLSMTVRPEVKPSIITGTHIIVDENEKLVDKKDEKNPAAKKTNKPAAKRGRPPAKKK